VDRFFDDIARAYDRGIQAPGKELHFLVLVAFALSFGFIRTSAHMIRAQVSWWPGNVETKGGTHVHHMVWGILLLLSMGYIGITIENDSPWAELVSIAFGIGMGLTLDEFALWLNLKDVYWEKQGRRSIDAVIVAAAITGIVLVGFRGWIDAAGQVESEVFALAGSIGGLGILFALINVAKEKFGMALLGLFVPFVSIAGAFRLGKPHSVWARLFYRHRRLERSERRYAGPRGTPFWKRGPELVGRLRLRGARS